MFISMFRFRYDKSEYFEIEGQAKSGQNGIDGVSSVEKSKREFKGWAKSFDVGTEGSEQECRMVQDQEQKVASLMAPPFDQC